LPDCEYQQNDRLARPAVEDLSHGNGHRANHLRRLGQSRVSSTRLARLDTAHILRLPSTLGRLKRECGTKESCRVIRQELPVESPLCLLHHVLLGLLESEPEEEDHSADKRR